MAWGVDCGGPTANNPEVWENADSYAVYAEYGFFVGKGLTNMWNSDSFDAPNPVQIPMRRRS